MVNKLFALGIMLSAFEAFASVDPKAGADVPAPFLPAEIQATRAPAYPLMTHDPYFSVWSSADTLSSDVTRFWSGATKTLTSMVRIDQHSYRLMGVKPEAVEAMAQTNVYVTPTRTIYTFAGAGVELRLIFMSPLLPSNLDWLSRPVSYVTWQVRSTDQTSHQVEVYFDSAADLVVQEPQEAVAWQRLASDGLEVLRMGTVAQPVLRQAGDQVAINWGYLFQAVPSDRGSHQAIVEDSVARVSFATSGVLPASDDSAMPRAANDRTPVLATAMDLGLVQSAWTERYLMLAYDDQFAVTYMRQRLRPYWRRGGAEAPELLQAAMHDYTEISTASQAFDAELSADLKRVGGQSFMRLAILSYRQTWAAHKLAAAADGSPLLFSKENSSNGCMSTVDVSFPASPFLLLFSPTLMKGLLTPVLDYAAGPRWRFPFAPHDIGTYPLGNGQVYGGHEESTVDQMPVEETGNFLIMLAAIAQAEGKVDYAERYWPMLAKWAAYLEEAGFDPANQLASEDFAGYLAHNVNLSAKAVIALAAYARLAEQSGRMIEAAHYRTLSNTYAEKWLDQASDGDHFRLAFDKPHSWSAKYNLVWDKVLGLGVFNEGAMARETHYYDSVRGSYGLPLDSRATYTLLHTSIWGASLTGLGKTFRGEVDALEHYAESTPNRIPLSDWFDTADARSVGFQARSVVGGIFLPMLFDRDVWHKWNSHAAVR